MKKRNEMKIEKRACFCGVASAARKFGVSREHLSRVLHGTRKANDTLRRRLWRLGIVKTVDGREI